jgi:hypothetical protein
VQIQDQSPLKRHHPRQHARWRGRTIAKTTGTQACQSHGSNQQRPQGKLPDAQQSRNPHRHEIGVSGKSLSRRFCVYAGPSIPSTWGPVENVDLLMIKVLRPELALRCPCFRIAALSRAVQILFAEQSRTHERNAIPNLQILLHKGWHQMQNSRQDRLAMTKRVPYTTGQPLGGQKASAASICVFND